MTNLLLALSASLAILPLLAAFGGLLPLWIVSILALGAEGVLAGLVESDRLAALVGLPFLLAAIATSFHVVLRRRKRIRANVEEDQERRRSLESRHASLKEAVAVGEAEERRSLQLYGAANSLAESLSWKDMGPRLTAALQKVFGAFEILLYAIDEKGVWTPLHRRGNWVKEPPVADPRLSEAAFFHPPRVAEPVPVLAVPVSSHESGGVRQIGMLYLKSSERRSEDDLLAAGREFGPQLAVAVSKALLFNQMERLSRVDGLTGTLRRQPFMDRFAEELKRALVFHTAFSVLMVDIDHFKSVNDTHGHPAGDAVLTRVGEVLRESFYETDVVGRYGGEEFIVLLPRAEADGVFRKADALRRRFESETISFGFEQLRITVSIGLAHFPDAGRTAEELIARADQALYAAKEGGRNRVIAA